LGCADGADLCPECEESTARAATSSRTVRREKMRERLYLADVPELKRAELCDVLRQSVCFIFFTFCFPRAERLPKREKKPKVGGSNEREILCQVWNRRQVRQRKMNKDPARRNFSVFSGRKEMKRPNERRIEWMWRNQRRKHKRWVGSDPRPFLSRCVLLVATFPSAPCRGSRLSLSLVHISTLRHDAPAAIPLLHLCLSREAGYRCPICKVPFLSDWISVKLTNISLVRWSRLI
jgi:hypothetical protein